MLHSLETLLSDLQFALLGFLLVGGLRTSCVHEFLLHAVQLALSVLEVSAQLLVIFVAVDHVPDERLSQDSAYRGYSDSNRYRRNSHLASNLIALNSIALRRVDGKFTCLVWSYSVSFHVYHKLYFIILLT